MKRYLFILTIFTFWLGGGPVSADDAIMTMTLQGENYASVKGDKTKFQALNWRRAGGGEFGIKDAFYKAMIDKDTTITFEGDIVPREYTGKGKLLIEREDAGFVKLNYDTFRKYFSNKGGFFSGYPTNYLPSLDKNLDLDMGNLLFEIGKGSASDPDLSFSYERKTKQGSKSSTIWDTVRDSGFGGTGTGYQRKLAPTFIDIDDVIETLMIKEKIELAGFNVKGDQKYVFFDGDRNRESRQISTTFTDQDYTREFFDTQTKQLSNTVRASRWSANDKTYFDLGYRFSHHENSQIYSLITLNENYVFPATFIGVEGENTLDSHVWTGQLLSNLTNKLALISQVKAEVKKASSNSDESTITTATGAKSGTELYMNENEVTTIGEKFSLRYAAMPRMSIYSELEMEQEQRREVNVGNHGNWDAFTNFPKYTGTLGSRLALTKTINVTTELKYGQDKKKVKTKSKNDPGTLDFLYYDLTKKHQQEASSRVSWKPTKWFQGNLRYNMASYNRNIQPVSELGLSGTDTLYYQRDLVLGFSLIPNDQWMFDMSFSRERTKINGTPSTVASSAPPSTSNVNSFLFTANYAPTEKFNLFSSLEYSRAKNNSNEGSANLTDTTGGTSIVIFDVNSEWYNVDTGITWALKDNVNIEPHYAYSSYRVVSGVDGGNFTAHMFGLNVNCTF